MSTSKAQRHRSARARLALLAALVVQLVVPGLARGAAFETYSVTGYEVWFTPTVGTFVGTGGGSAGTLSAWHSSIEHSVVISPTGTITGGWATLYRLDGVRISGYFSDGTVQQTYDGPDCTRRIARRDGKPDERLEERQRRRRNGRLRGDARPPSCLVLRPLHLLLGLRDRNDQPALLATWPPVGAAPAVSFPVSAPAVRGGRS